MRTFSLFSILLFLFILANPPAIYAKQARETKASATSRDMGQYFYKTYPLSSFSAVYINAPMNVQLTCSQTNYATKIFLNNYIMQNTRVYVRKGVLNIFIPAKVANLIPYPLSVQISAPYLNEIQKIGTGYLSGTNLHGPLCLEIWGNSNTNLCGTNIDLRNLKVVGPANVTVNGMCSRVLNVQHFGEGLVDLRGTAVLQSLLQSGSGNTAISCISSTCAKVTGYGSGKICLAGNVCCFKAFLYGCTCLNARNLPVQRGYIETNEGARANVWVTDSLTAVAKDSSVIFYYNDPRFVGKFMFPPATILRMSGIR